MFVHDCNAPVGSGGETRSSTRHPGILRSPLDRAPLVGVHVVELILKANPRSGE